ncbi:MAG: hypothetical protein LBC08_02915 [Campylobacteraceae bacterium]|jgi:hypothetical protein|nr:hypothetical protein [Campylobacteraceae bacterium]
MELKTRKPTELELKLIELLIDKSSLKFPNWKEKLAVSEMDDGQMGSLTLLPNGYYEKKKRFAKQVSEYEFLDLDGVLVSAALYIDDISGELYELDIWKVNFEPLMKININD